MKTKMTMMLIWVDEWEFNGPLFWHVEASSFTHESNDYKTLSIGSPKQVLV